MPNKTDQPAFLSCNQEGKTEQAFEAITGFTKYARTRYEMDSFLRSSFPDGQGGIEVERLANDMLEYEPQPRRHVITNWGSSEATRKADLKKIGQQIMELDACAMLKESGNKLYFESISNQKHHEFRLSVYPLRFKCGCLAESRFFWDGVTNELVVRKKGLLIEKITDVKQDEVLGMIEARLNQNRP